MKSKRKPRKSRSVRDFTRDPEFVRRVLAKATEHRRDIAILRGLERAAPPEEALYYRLARLMLLGVQSDEVKWHLMRLAPGVLRRIDDALEAPGKDKAAIKMMKVFLAERKAKGNDITIRNLQARFAKTYPKDCVPERRSWCRTLRKYAGWQFKRGRPPRK